jgi:hypothetical protein
MTIAPTQRTGHRLRWGLLAIVAVIVVAGLWFAFFRPWPPNGTIAGRTLNDREQSQIGKGSSASWFGVNVPDATTLTVWAQSPSGSDDSFTGSWVGYSFTKGDLLKVTGSRSGGLDVTVSLGDLSVDKSMTTPFNLSAVATMSGSLVGSPRHVEKGVAFPLWFLVANDADHMDGDATLVNAASAHDPTAIASDPATFAQYDYAIVLWAKFE